MASIKLKHSGGNSVSIAAPSSNPASDRTLTLPSDADGTIVSKDTSNNVAGIASINGGAIGTKNLIINGAMNVAQRGTSSTDNGYATIDRFKISRSGVDEFNTQAQVALTSSDTGPYEKGFRNCFKVTNGNQTGGAGDNDRLEIQYLVEAQDLASSGWNYTSASSFITLSFWIKSSVAQAFFVRLQTQDGTQYRYKTSTGSLSANTWTKITKTIPGNSNLVFDNNTGPGLRLSFYAFAGTNYSDSSATETWAANETGNRTSDMTSTWYTTNDATLELTGVQLEVGSVATDFEHRTYEDELRRCQRYFQTLGGSPNYCLFAPATGNGGTVVTAFYKAPVTFRAVPAYSYSSLSDLNIYDFGAETSRGSPTGSALITSISNKDWIYIDNNVSGTTAGAGHMFRANNTANARFNLDADF